MITIANLSKSFDQRMLLDKVSLSIYRDEKIGLTGPNGAGKTTLFSIILKEQEPTGGELIYLQRIVQGSMRLKYCFTLETSFLKKG